MVLQKDLDKLFHLQREKTSTDFCKTSQRKVFLSFRSNPTKGGSKADSKDLKEKALKDLRL
jgi:hypothetical protein